MTINGIDSIHNSEQGPQDGLTKREYFAAMVMQGFIASGWGANEMDLTEAAKRSAMASDALIHQLNKTPTNEAP